jgi:flagellar basal body-associated protein FliL
VSFVPGAIAIVIVLLIFPVIAIAGSVAMAALLGWSLNRDAEDRNQGSELVDVNY